MKIRRKIAAVLVLSILMMGIQGFAATGKIVLDGAKLDSYHKFTPVENLFRLAACPGKEFVLLDSDQDGFLLLANEIYSAVPFDSDGTQKFDLTDDNNIAYYLNHTLVNDGALFPQEILPYIDKDRVWKTEPGTDGGDCPSEYSVTCGLSLLSYDEFMRYYKLFGLQDDYVRKDWWLRSPLGSTNAVSTGIASGGTYINEGKLVSSATTASLGVRPVFWVNRNFFQDVKVSIPYLGEHVAERLRGEMTMEELQSGKAAYTDYECKRLGYAVSGVPDEHIKITFPNEPLYTQNQQDAYVEVDLSISGNNSIDYIVEYSKDGTFEDAVSQEYTVTPYQGIEAKIDLSGLKKGKYKDFTVRVKNHNGILAVKTTPLTIMEFVGKQPLSEYSRVGINWHIDYNTADFITGKTDVYGYAIENYNKLMNMMGITKTRSIHRWAWSETVRGKRANGRHSFANSLMVKYGQTFAPYILGFANPAFFSGEPKNYAQVMEEVEYCTDILDYLGKRGVQIDALELWNEPNLTSFWGSSRWITYSQLANRLAFEMNKLYPDIPLMGCAFSMQDAYPYVDAYFRRGGLMYVGGLSGHPYTHPTNPDISDFSRTHVNRTLEMVKKRSDAGGWLELSQTEVGFPTAQNASSVADTVTQARYLPKLYIYNDDMDMYLTNLYTFEDTGWNYNDVEHNWGIVGLDLIPKEAVVTISQFNKYAANANYLGRFKIQNDSYVYVYQKLDKLFAILWSTSEEEVFEYTLENGVSAEDMYGNPVKPHDGTITVGQDLIYLNDIPVDYMAKAVSYRTAEEFARGIERIGEKIDTSELAVLADSFTEESCQTPESLKRHINVIFELGNTLIDQYVKNPEMMDLKQLSTVLSELYFASKRAVYAYSYFEPSVENSNRRLEDIKKQIAEKKGNEPDSSLLYTDAMMRFASEQNKKANDIRQNYAEEFRGKISAISAADMLAGKLLVWIEKFIDLEEPDVSRAIFTYLEETNITVYKGQNFEYKMEVENLTNHDISGTVVWHDENGKALGKEYECSIKASECGVVSFGGTIPNETAFGDHIYYVDIMEDGRLLKRSEIDVSVENKILAELNDSNTSVNNMTDVSVNLTSTYNEKVMGTVKIEAPEGWKLESQEKRFVIAPGETQSVKFNISKIEMVPFHEYDFKYTVTDHEGIVMAEGEELLDFLVAVRTDQEINAENFDGDISGWENAYPIHINPPENNKELSAWTDANISIKSFMKWDDNYYYILTDVYDNLHNQRYTGNQIWQGDSIQIAFDTLNDDTTSYSADDYEYGVAHTALGTEVQGFAAASGKTIGEKPSKWAKIIRDNQNHVTRYLVKIPKTELAPLNFREGTEFGFNLCANDADLLERDSVVEFTAGVNGSKRPNLFKTFKLIGNERGAMIREGEEYSFIQKINDTGFSE